MAGCSWTVRRLTISSALCVRRVMTLVEQKGCAANQAAGKWVWFPVGEDLALQTQPIQVNALHQLLP